MRKKNNKSIIFTVLFYISAIITVIFNQISIQNNSDILNEINFYSIFIMTILLSMFIINNYVIISIIKEKISIKGIINITIRTLLYYLINIMIVNKLDSNTTSIIFITLILILSTIDIVLLIMNFRKVNILIIMNDEEILKHKKDYKVKAMDNSKKFKYFQLNIFLILISFFSIYIANVFIDYENKFHIVIFCTVLLCSLILSVKYVYNITKISDKIRFYHYLSVVVTNLAISLLLYYKANLLIFAVPIILIPIIKLDKDVRRCLLNEENNTK